MVKISYSCMNNMSSIIPSNNKRLIRPRTTKFVCNCRTRENCPLQNQCLTPNEIYQSDVENNKNKGIKIYFGLAETFFKERFRNHNKDIKHEQYRKITELSKYMCLLNKEQIMCRIGWSNLKKVYGEININFCPLWLAEKVHFIIEHSDGNRVLNIRDEFISGPRHQVKLLLKSFKRK